ncbi:MAG TPA: carbohydrate kinase family protein [Chloroflexaceae bacterium]|nr:carbohydrate kinase family protein [Chloroflexaceae bacterium]
MARVTVVGNVNLETTLRVEGFPVPYTPTTYAPFGVASGVSAVGANLARALTALGDSVALASLIGADAPAALVRAALRAENIGDAFVLATAAATPQSVVLYDGAGARAVHTDLKDVPTLTYPPDRFAAALAGSDLAVITNIAYSKPLIAVAQRLGVPIATDLHTLTDLGDAYNAPFLRAAHILFLSGELLGVEPADWAEAVLAASPAEIVVIGLGARGAYLAVRGTGLRLALPTVTVRPVVQTGGAGDALLAAFLHGHLAGADPARALRAATVFAAYKIGAARSGEGFLGHDELERLLAQVSGTE